MLLGVNDTRYQIAAVVPGRTGEVDLSWYDQSVVDDLSPDGRLMLFHESGDAFEERFEIFVRGTDGSPPVDLGPGYPFALSPDGKWALASPSRELAQLALIQTGAGNARPLPVGSLAGIAQAFFFADGARILIRAR